MAKNKMYRVGVSMVSAKNAKAAYDKVVRGDYEKDFMAEEITEQKDLEVVIEVGGDNGDGIVAVVKKPKGVKVIVRDFDNAELPEDADEDTKPIPQEEEYDADSVIG